MKKIFNILWWIGILALSTFSCTFAYTQEQRDAYQWAYKYGITTQPTIESANLDWNLTRQAFAKMVVNYLEKAVWMQQNNSNSCTFPDENKFTNELKYYAKKTCAYQIMWENWTNFNPTNIVNRAQLWTVLSRILWWWEHNASGKDYYIYHLNALKFIGIMNKIDNPQTYAKRWDVLIMLKRIYEKYGSNIYMNWNQDSSYDNNSANINSKIYDNQKYLTKEEIQKIIEKEEWLKEGSLDSRWYECSWEKCNYKFSYSADWKEYIYNRENSTSAKTEKIQDLWINNAEEVALKDAKVSKSNTKIEDSFSSDWYIITITTKDNVFIYTISLDWKIKEKKTLITEKKALKTILKEVKLEQSQSDIENENKEICLLSYSFFGDDHDIYHCSFTYWWKQYLSYVNAHDWSIIPIKKTGSSIQYWKNITWKENVIISEKFTYIDGDKAEEILTKKYNIKWSSSRTRRMWEGSNAIYIYATNGTEYYIDAINWTKMYSKDEIYTALAKDSWVSKDIIKNSKKSFEDSDSIDDGIIEMSYFDIDTQDVVSIYLFINQWTTYTYKVRNIDWKILDSKKETDIWEDKAKESAKQIILKKYSADLKDEEIYYWNRAYIWYQSNASSDDYFKAPSEPKYVVCFSDKDEKYIYRAILRPDGSVISDDKAAIDEMGFLSSLYYIMWYSLDEINELKDKSIEIWGSLSL